MISVALHLQILKHRLQKMEGTGWTVVSDSLPRPTYWDGQATRFPDHHSLRSQLQNPRLLPRLRLWAEHYPRLSSRSRPPRRWSQLVFWREFRLRPGVRAFGWVVVSPLSPGS